MKILMLISSLLISGCASIEAPFHSASQVPSPSLSSNKIAVSPFAYQIAQRDGRIMPNDSKEPPSFMHIKIIDERLRKIITPKADDPNVDFWTDRADVIGHGDCEDYALTFRRKLIENGLDGGNLAVTDTKEGLHVILLVANVAIDINGISNIERHNLIKIERDGSWYKV